MPFHSGSFSHLEWVLLTRRIITFTKRNNHMLKVENSPSLLAKNVGEIHGSGALTYCFWIPHFPFPNSLPWSFCIGLTKKFIQVSPYCLTGKPEWPFWPTQYIYMCVCYIWYSVVISCVISSLDFSIPCFSLRSCSTLVDVWDILQHWKLQPLCIFIFG